MTTIEVDETEFGNSYQSFGRSIVCGEMARIHKEASAAMKKSQMHVFMWDVAI